MRLIANDRPIVALGPATNFQLPEVPTMAWTCLEWQFTDQPDTDIACRDSLARVLVALLEVDGLVVPERAERRVDLEPGHPQLLARIFVEGPETSVVCGGNEH
jgi:hypothetical protein